MSRAQTMVLALLVVHVMLGAVCLAVARGEREAPALRYWGWGLCFYSGGLLLTLAQFLPAAPTLTIGNAAVAYAPVLCIRGVMENTHRRLNARWVGAALGATILLIVYGNFAGPPNAKINLVGPSPLAIALFLFAALVLLERPAPEVRNATRFLSVALALAAFVWILRDASVWGALGGSNDRDRVDFVVAMFVLAQILVAIAATLCLFWIEVRKMEGVLEHMAFNDPLTELPNRRSALLRFREEAARSVRHQVPFALLVVDVDHFKQVNDRHGHQVGDEVLKHVARLLAAEKRVEDMLARIGGEEFACLLSDSSRADAELVANRMREIVAQTPLTVGGAVLRVTVSGGLALYPDDGEGWEEMFAAADRRLYEAKAAGRDRITA